jgi:hypothetical protein
MELMMIDEEAYFREIEEYFLQKRGDPMLLKPTEWTLIREWYEAAIPAEVVLRGIDRAFERKTDDEDKHSLSLRYCRRLVKSEHKRHLRSLEGKASEKPQEAVDFQQYFSNLVTSLSLSSAQARSKENAALADLLEQKTIQLDKEIVQPFRNDPSPNLQRVEHQLTTIEKEIEQALLLLISEDQMNHLKEDAMRDLKTFEQKLELPVYQEMVNRSVIKTLRKQYGIPRLSLFYL